MVEQKRGRRELTTFPQEAREAGTGEATENLI
jgi:hypothetical protein